MQTWFLALLLSPVTVVEILFSLVYFGRSEKAALYLLLLVSCSFLSMFVFSHQAEPNNKAVWGSAMGFALHETYRPRALLPNTMIVKVKATSLNQHDSTYYNKIPLVPFVRWVMHQSPGVDIAGVVVDINCFGTKFNVGDAVFAQGMGGTQEYAAVLCTRAGKIPPQVPFTQAAASVSVFLTGLAATRPLPYDANVIVILDASEERGQAGILLAKNKRAKNIVCVNPKQHHALVLRMGCTEAMDSSDPMFFTDILAKWKGKADMVYDTVSAYANNPYFPTLVDLLNKWGRYRALGALFDRYLVGGPLYQRYELVRPENKVVDIEEMEDTPLFFNLHLASVLDALNATNVQYAFDLLNSQQMVGKIVLTVGDQFRD